MKTLLLLLATSVLFAGCDDRSKTTPKAPALRNINNYATIVVDMDHYQTERKDGTDPPQYSINNSDGLILDTTVFQPKLAPQFADKECNSIQLIMANDRQYSAEYDQTKTRHILDSTTLKPNPGSKPFSGIHSGDRCIIAVGHMGHEAGQPPAFSVAWLSVANIEDNR